MNTKALLHETAHCLMKKYADYGITITGQNNGMISSTLSFELNDREKKTFTVIITETTKKFE